MAIVEPVNPELSDASRRPRKAIVTKDDLRGMLADQTASLAQAKELIESMHGILLNFQNNGITVETPEGKFTISQVPPAPIEEPKSAEEIAKDQYLVNTVFMDFIEIHAALMKGFRDRRPLLGNAVQARYTDHAEPTLLIMRKGDFGTNDQMYNTALTLLINDEDPYIGGDYMDYGKTVTMSADQVKRCVSTILDCIRKETNPE